MAPKTNTEPVVCQRPQLEQVENVVMCSMEELTFAHIKKKRKQQRKRNRRERQRKRRERRIERNSRDKAEKGESVAEPRLDLLPTTFFFRFFRFQLLHRRHLIGCRRTFSSSNLLHQSHRQLFQGHRKQFLRHQKVDVKKLDIQKPQIAIFWND